MCIHKYYLETNSKSHTSQCELDVSMSLMFRTILLKFLKNRNPLKTTRIHYARFPLVSRPFDYSAKSLGSGLESTSPSTSRAIYYVSASPSVARAGTLSASLRHKCLRLRRNAYFAPRTRSSLRAEHRVVWIRRRLLKLLVRGPLDVRAQYNAIAFALMNSDVMLCTKRTEWSTREGPCETLSRPCTNVRTWRVRPRFSLTRFYRYPRGATTTCKPRGRAAARLHASVWEIGEETKASWNETTLERLRQRSSFCRVSDGVAFVKSLLNQLVPRCFRFCASTAHSYLLFDEKFRNSATKSYDR